MVQGVFARLPLIGVVGTGNVTQMQEESRLENNSASDYLLHTAFAARYKEVASTTAKNNADMYIYV